KMGLYIINSVAAVGCAPVEYQPVCTGAAQQNVRVCCGWTVDVCAREHVVAGSAIEVVRSIVADNLIVASATASTVGSCIAADAVGAVAATYRIIAVVAQQGVGAARGRNGVIAVKHAGP